MSSVSGTGDAALSYAKEAYSANLAKEAHTARGQQALDLLEGAKVEPITPTASSGTHITTDNLGQNINIQV